LCFELTGTYICDAELISSVGSGGGGSSSSSCTLVWRPLCSAILKVIATIVRSVSIFLSQYKHVYLPEKLKQIVGDSVGFRNVQRATDPAPHVTITFACF